MKESEEVDDPEGRRKGKKGRGKERRGKGRRMDLNHEVGEGKGKAGPPYANLTLCSRRRDINEVFKVEERNRD